jgi:N-acetylmuramoyl-L-alanine amidase
MFSAGQINAHPDGKTPKAFTVTIDAGHGGKDPGAVGKKTVEKKIALAIALKLGEYIENGLENTRVVYTRNTDVFIPLDERANIANRNKSDLFISIHVDGSKSNVPKGTSSFVMGTSKNSSNLDLVMRENKVIMLEDNYQNKYEGFDPNSPASFIIFNLYQNVNLKQSLLFATLVQDHMRTQAKRNDRGVSQEGFLVLWKTTMPSVLVETGFMSNAEEEAYLMTEEGQANVANAIYSAFKRYREDPESRIEGNLVAAADKASGKDTITVEKKIDSAVITKDPVFSRKSEEASIEKPKTDTSRSVAQITKAEPVVEFRVQVLASPKRLPSNSPDFKGKKGFDELFIDGYYKYMTKPVRAYEDALLLRKGLSATFKGAFIVAFKDGSRVPLTDVVKEQ